MFFSLKREICQWKNTRLPIKFSDFFYYKEIKEKQNVQIELSANLEQNW